MTVTIADTTKNPIVIQSGKTANPFTSIALADTVLPNTINTTIGLTDIESGASGDTPGILSLSGNVSNFNLSTSTLTFPTAVSGANTGAATAELGTVLYTAPTLAAGDSEVVTARLSAADPGTTADPTPVTIDVVTAPIISGTVANEPTASATAIKPFATARIVDTNFDYGATVTATITATDGGTATDADGLLSGTGLSKTGVGTYSLTGSVYTVQGELDTLSFGAAAAAAGVTRTTNFDLNVADVGAGLAADDKTTSVLTLGPTAAPAAPLIAGVAAMQTVAPGNAISPFANVTVSDTNATPMDSAVLTVTGGGTLSGNGLTGGPNNTYTIAASTPAALTALLDGVSFASPALGGAASNASMVALSVTDNAQQSASASTTITETATAVAGGGGGGGSGGGGGMGGGPTSGNFTIADQTTGQQTFDAGTPYVGPVQGIVQQEVLITPDNLNITASIPNVFIHTGAGTDAIDVSKVNGNNILDGSTGSNFLVGGTGDDTFYLDDRSPLADVFSTIQNFHAGDNATIFGVNPTNFKLTTLDNQGAVGAKGLDFAFTAPGAPNANLVVAGYTTADLSNGRLTVTYGTTPDTPGLPGSQYMNIHGN